MQLLQNQGFTVIVIHNANNEKWSQVLEMMMMMMMMMMIFT
jgi:hypothetical protein